MTLDDAYKEIEKRNLPFVRITDSTGYNTICLVEDVASGADAVSEIKRCEPWLKSHKLFTLKAKHDKNLAWTNDKTFTWRIENNAGTDTAVKGAPANYGLPTFNEVMAMYMGMNNQVQAEKDKALNSQIELIKEQNRMQLELYKLKQDDPMKFAPLFPIIGKFMGWTPDEIKQTMMMGAQAMAYQNMAPTPPAQQRAPGALAGTPAAEATHKLTFEEAQKMPAKDLHEKILHLMNEELPNKVSAQSMYMMLQAVNNNPFIAALFQDPNAEKLLNYITNDPQQATNIRRALLNYEMPA